MRPDPPKRGPGDASNGWRVLVVRHVPPSAGVGHHDDMELRPGLVIDDAVLADFVAWHGVRRLALYGSILGDDFGPGSDVDILVEFKPGRTPGLLRLAQMELELESALGRQVELRTYEDLSHYFRDEIAAIARPLYAA